MNKSIIALCDSDKCAFIESSRIRIKKGKSCVQVEAKHIGAQVKTVSKYAVDCPDCGSVLFGCSSDILLNERKKIG